MRHLDFISTTMSSLNFDPNNVKDQCPRAKIADFNYARWVTNGNLSVERPSAGFELLDHTTMEYIPPEIWEKESNLACSIDIYAFGIISSEIATTLAEKKYYAPFAYGFQWNNFFEKIAYLRKGNPPKWPAQIDEKFAEIIHMCVLSLAKDRPPASQLISQFFTKKQ